MNYAQFLQSSTVASRIINDYGMTLITRRVGGLGKGEITSGISYNLFTAAMEVLSDQVTRGLAREWIISVSQYIMGVAAIRRITLT